MMTYDILLALVAFAFVSSITPGPNNLMLLASGTNFGLRRTVPHLAGVNVGFVLMTMMVGLGLASVLEVFPQAVLVLKVASAIYLVYLSWKIATAAPLADDSPSASSGTPMTFLQAVAFQWVNPKAWAMTLTAVSAYTVTARPLVSLGIIGLVFAVVQLPCITSWAVLGTQIRRFLSSSLRLRAFNIVAALLLLGTIWPILGSAGLSGH